MSKNVIKMLIGTSRFILGVSILTFSAYALSNETKKYEECLLQSAKNNQEEVTLEQLRESCAKPYSKLVYSRIRYERDTRDNPFVITPHRMNYILPYTYTNNINAKPYDFSELNKNLTNSEAKFQISIKVPLNNDDIFVNGDGLYFGFTMKSWWQIYAENISKPFRETNYRPELFYAMPLETDVFKGDTFVIAGIEHESNGQVQYLSRSWNRIYTMFAYEQDNLVLTLRPWWRIPEDTKKEKFDPNGDDNPDIDKYYGNFELESVYKWKDYNFSFLGRQNFAEHKGYMELGVTFPLWGKLRGYAQYVSGYGESLLDYNHNQQRIGIGITLTDLI